MKVDEFILLTLPRQFDVLLQKAVMIANRYESNGRYFLFQLDDFYIELKANLHNDTILQMMCFTDTEGLNRYLDKIDISGVFYDKY